jgi:hypothetical protein
VAPYSILPPHQTHHEPHQRVASPVGDSIPEPHPEARSEPPGECPAPWATVLPTSPPPAAGAGPPGCGGAGCWVLGAGCWVWSAVCGLRSAGWRVLVAPIPGCCVTGWPPRAAGLLVQAGDVVLVLMRAPPAAVW